MELDSVKMEYANAKLECNAADERGKILASEVIGLEEKVVNFFGMLVSFSSSLPDNSSMPLSSL